MFENLEERKAKVLRRSDTDSSWKEIHRGVVVGETTHYLQVFRPKMDKDDSSGDVTPETAEFFPKNGKLIKTIEFEYVN